MKKNVQGSTLIEVIVSLAIVVIALGIMLSAVTTSQKIITRSKEYGNSSATSLNGIVNGEGNNNTYEDETLDIIYSLNAVSFKPEGVIRKVTNNNVTLVSFVPDNTIGDGTLDDGASSGEKSFIPGTTIEVNVLHPDYKETGNKNKLHYKNGTTIMYNNVYYYVNKNINIQNYDDDSDPYEVINNNLDKLIKFTGVNHTSISEFAQIGDTFKIGDKFNVYTKVSPNIKYKEIS